MTPTMKKLLVAIKSGTVVRTGSKSGEKYTFGWAAPCGSRTVEEAIRLGYAELMPPEHSHREKFLAMGRVGGLLVLTSAGEALLVS